jgi:hypothetical protein
MCKNEKKERKTDEEAKLRNLLCLFCSLPPRSRRNTTQGDSFLLSYHLLPFKSYTYKHTPTHTHTHTHAHTHPHTHTHTQFPQMLEL